MGLLSWLFSINLEPTLLPGFKLRDDLYGLRFLREMDLAYHTELAKSCECGEMTDEQLGRILGNGSISAEEHMLVQKVLARITLPHDNEPHQT